MRWVVVTVLFVVSVFGFFVGFGISSLILTELNTALTPMSHANVINIMTVLQSAFGVICALALVMLVIIYGIDALSDEPEHYWR